MSDNPANTAAKCPVMHAAPATTTTNQDWWPKQLKVELLHQHSSKSNPMGEDFDYAKEFKTLDLAAVEEGSVDADDRFAGVVAGGFRPLRSFVYSNGVAQRRHLPHRRRSRRRGVAASSASRRSTAGRITSAWTRLVGCCGPSSKSTAANSPGRT